MIAFCGGVVLGFILGAVGMWTIVYWMEFH